MLKIRQVYYVVASNFRRWNKNPQIILCFFLGFIFCFLLSDKVMNFAVQHDTYLQGLEAFIWTFGDSQSILSISLLLLLLFADIPNLSNDVPFFMIRTKRSVWLLGQIIYLISATFIFVTFIFFSTIVLSATRAYPANIWSETAAILGYSDIGQNIAVPSFVKVMELTYPYQCSVHIFLLVIGYSLAMSSIILFFNLCKNNMGMIGGVLFSGFGIILNPTMVAELFGISFERMRYANIIFGWLSPLNHATYYMHNFGYDNLPKLWMSYLFFALFSLVFFILSFWKIKKYSFDFTGTQS